MTGMMQVFSNVSDTKVWIENRISNLKSKLDDRQSLLFDSLDKIGSDIESSRVELTLELDKLKVYRTQTVSLFGEATQNISAIDSKISEVESKLNETGSEISVSVTWVDEEIVSLISHLGGVKTDPQPAQATPVPKDHVAPKFPPPVPTKPPKKQSETKECGDYVIDSLEQSGHEYETVIPEGDKYEIMETPRSKSPVAYYEDMGDLDEENVPPRFPKLPSFSCCPEGTANGQIMKPKTICVDPSSGNLYVVEKGNNRVQILSPGGEHLRFFADKSNKMSNPYGICYANNHVYVTQSTLNCVYIFTPNGSYVKKFGKEGSGEGRFSLPSCLAPSPPKKHIYICDTGNDRVQVFDFSNNFVRVFGVGQLLRPVDVVCDSARNVIVLDRGPKCLHVFGHCGNLLYNTVPFSSHKQVSNPLFLTLGPKDELYLSDYARNCVFVFSSDGAMRGQIGGEGVFVEPRGLVFDSKGRLVVLSCNRSGCLQFFEV